MQLNKVLSLAAIGLLIAAPKIYGASDVLELTFNRTGSAASSVTINTSGIEGVTATMTSVSHTMKTTAGSVTSQILCPNVNGNTSPTITMEFQITGLPAGFTIDDLNLDIHALNGANGYQVPDDNKQRLFNVTAAVNGTTFGSLDNIDIAAGVNTSGTTRNKVWSITPTTAVTPGSPLTLKLTITKGTVNEGCFFGLSAVRFNTPVPEVRPFTPVTSLEQANAFYYILNADEYALDNTPAWTSKKPDTAQKWCFVGTSNAAGGYIIANAKTGATLAGGKRFTVDNGSTTGLYTFTDPDGNQLEIAGCNEFRFSTFRDHNNFALSAQIYTLPCGTLGSNFISSVIVKSAEGYSDLHYPMAVTSGSTISYPTATRPSARYTMMSRDHATVAAGQHELDITLNTTPTTADRVIAYFDWDRDGYFEDMTELTPAKSMHASFTVPTTARTGRSRMRIRLTDNGLTDADDDVNGQVLDLFLECIDADANKFDPEVTVNSPGRGKATYDTSTQTATAVRYGSATFLYWREGNRIYSVEPQCEIAPAPTRRKFTAVFSPNLNDLMSGIDNTRLDTTTRADIRVSGRLVEVNSADEVTHLMVFSLDGTLRFIERGPVADISALAPGLYIIKAVTTTGTASAKAVID